MHAGIVVHDTVTSPRADNTRLAALLRRGVTQSSGKFLKGPIYHTLIGRDGSIHNIAPPEVKANHAGRVDGQRFKTLAAGSPPPAGTPRGGKISRNRQLISVALARAAGETPPPAQLDALARHCAGLCAARGWTADRVWGHLELTGRKIDPGDWPDPGDGTLKAMPRIRARVRGALDDQPGMESWADVCDWARRTLQNAGITDGRRPEEPITREEVWVMLARAREETRR